MTMLVLFEYACTYNIVHCIILYFYMVAYKKFEYATDFSVNINSFTMKWILDMQVLFLRVIIGQFWLSQQKMSAHLLQQFNLMS